MLALSWLWWVQLWRADMVATTRTWPWNDTSKTSSSTWEPWKTPPPRVNDWWYFSFAPWLCSFHLETLHFVQILFYQSSFIVSKTAHFNSANTKQTRHRNWHRFWKRRETSVFQFERIANRNFILDQHPSPTSSSPGGVALVINGDSLGFALGPKLEGTFLEIACKCQVCFLNCLKTHSSIISF